MSKRLASDGTQLQYAAEATAGNRPTAGFAEVSDELKSVPEINPTPDLREVTTFKDAADGAATYIPGIKKMNGAFAFKFNNTEDFHTSWAALITAYNTAKAAGKAMWFAIIIPGLTKSVYFKGVPMELGLDAMDVEAVAEITAYITPEKFDGWAAKPTVQGQ